MTQTDRRTDADAIDTDEPELMTSVTHDLALESAPDLSRLPGFHEWRWAVDTIQTSIEAAVPEGEGR